jgi:hypothetical protein
MNVRSCFPSPSGLLITLLLALLTANTNTNAAPPRLDLPILSANRNVQLTLHGDVGAEYSVEWSVNLSQWALIGTGIAANGLLTLHHDASAFSTIFYRAKGTAALQTLRIYPDRLSLNVGSEGPLLPLQSSGALEWSSSDSTVATVDTNGLVKALAKGATTITATSGAQTGSSIVTVYDPNGAAADAYSSTLLAQALADNAITPEEELIYRTYATFGDSRLPAQFQGAPSDVGNDLLLAEVANAIDTLSPAAQEILRPFLLPPMYAESWFAKQLGLSAAAGQGGALRSAMTPTVNCEATRLPHFYPRKSTAHFNIFYLQLGDRDYDKGGAQLADIVAAMAEEVYASETGLLQRFPLPDTTETCNGGDGATDIYITTIPSATLLAQVVPYHSGCAKTPSFILLNQTSAVMHYAGNIVSAGEGARPVKAVFAHEFMHVLQLAMDRRPDCAETKWLDEGTAEWAMDYVDSSFNVEDGFEKHSSKFKRSGAFLLEYLLWDHQAPIEKKGRGGDPEANGYVDYLFFQFLARKHTPDTIKQIFDGMAGPTGKQTVEAVASALGSRGGFKEVWPDFAKTLWNNSAAKLLDYWNTQDQYDMGLSYIFSPSAGEFRHHAGDRLKTIEIDQKGASKAKFTLLKSALESEGDYTIEPRSFYYEHMKFTDDTVHLALFVNPVGSIPAADREFIKVQGWKKIAGEWKGPEDWTADPYVLFCRDKKDERVEELLILVSNSEANRGTEKPFKIPRRFPMQLSTSNVGCWQWEGTASTEYLGGDGTVAKGIATGVVFDLTTNIISGIYFETTSGSVTGSGVTPLGPCTITSGGAQRTITKNPIPDGRIYLNPDLDMGFSEFGVTPDRKLNDFTGSSSLFTTTTFQCPDFTQTSTGEGSWDWLRVTRPWEIEVSADGQSIEGVFNDAGVVGGTWKVTFKFTAKRE